MSWLPHESAWRTPVAVINGASDVEGALSADEV